MKNSIKLLSLIALLSVSQLVLAQERWSFELRPGVNFPTTETLGSDLSTGFGGELVFGYRFLEHTGVYGGWGWNQFSQDDIDVEMTGYTFGLQFIHPINESSISYLVRAGGIYNHLEFEDDAGNITYDTGHGLGWEAGLGLELPLGDTFKLRPQVGYRSLSRETDFEGITEDADLNYISLSIGITKLF